MIELKLSRKRQEKKMKRETCLDCLHSSAYDSDINKLPRGRAYCRRYITIVFVGHAKICSLFEHHAPLSFERRKNKRRW